MDGSTIGIVAGAAGIVGVTVAAVGLMTRKQGRGNFHSPSNLHGKSGGFGDLVRQSTEAIGEIGHRFTGRGPRIK